MPVSPADLTRCFDYDRMASLIDEFSRYSKSNGEGVTRLAFSDEDRRAREAFVKIVESDLNLRIRADALGNLFARREGRHSNWPVIMTGSHLDSVRNGGKFDGPAGVFSSLEAFRALDILGIQTEHPFELCVLCSEEPNTFGISTFGSRGLTGILKKEDVAHLKDDSGQGLAAAIKNIGADLERMHEAVRPAGDIHYFVELHIEQMPYLDREKKDIGVVEGVTGIYRESVTLAGEPGHGGTTPMDRRKDALCAASELILTIESAARQESGEAVATIGHLSISPNSINIIPAQVVLDVEIRSYETERIQRIIAKMERQIASISDQRGMAVQRTVTYNSRPVGFSATVRDAIRQAAKAMGFSTLDLVSMAGHDAAHMNRVCDAGMIFIPCRQGLSHCPEEYSDTESIVKGAQCLLKTLLLLDALKGRE